MTTTYLEIDSTTRNRVMYKDPSDFVVAISQSGTRGVGTAFDPIAESAPVITWCPQVNMDTVNMNPVTGASIDTSPSSSTEKFYVTYSTSPSTDYGYYNGASIKVGPDQTTILGWELFSSSLSGKTVKFTVSPAISLPVTGSVVFDSQFGDGYIYIPGNSVRADNYYTGWYIYNDTHDSFELITSYDGESRIAGFNNNAAWESGNLYCLRKTLPEITSADVTMTGKVVDRYTFELTGTSKSIVPEFYKGYFLRIKDYSKNTAYTYEVASYNGVQDASNPTITLWQLTLKTSIIPDFTAGFTPPFEILGFTRDNMAPFVYTGSQVSQQQASCYEIELINLVLPNKTLVTGGISAFYPYVYVELSNISGGMNKNSIYSNNPNASSALFRAAIDDLPTPVVSPFVRIDSDGMRQTVKFQMNDSLHFRVYIPNGKSFTTLCSEQFSPVEPNPLIQISAVFSMRRL
jgi:hypothetical protein